MYNKDTFTNTDDTFINNIVSKYDTFFWQGNKKR